MARGRADRWRWSRSARWFPDRWRTSRAVPAAPGPLVPVVPGVPARVARRPGRSDARRRRAGCRPGRSPGRLGRRRSARPSAAAPRCGCPAAQGRPERMHRGLDDLGGHGVADAPVIVPLSSRVNPKDRCRRSNRLRSRSSTQRGRRGRGVPRPGGAADRDQGPGPPTPPGPDAVAWPGVWPARGRSRPDPLAAVRSGVASGGPLSGPASGSGGPPSGPASGSGGVRPADRHPVRRPRPAGAGSAFRGGRPNASSCSSASRRHRRVGI